MIKINLLPEDKRGTDLEELIEKIGIANSYLIFKDKLTPEQIESLDFEGWENIYLRSGDFIIDEEESKAMRRLALQKMLEHAENFSQLQNVAFFSRKSDDICQAAIEKMKAIAKLEDWIGVVASSRCNLATPEVKLLAADIIRQSVS